MGNKEALLSGSEAMHYCIIYVIYSLNLDRHLDRLPASKTLGFTIGY